jgi:hypothetical protein
MKIFKNLDEAVNSVNPTNTPFLVKSFVDKLSCDKALVDLTNYQQEFSENERFHGENWYYLVDKFDSQFFSFNLNSLNSLQSNILSSMYLKLFDAYRALGDDIERDFEFHVQNEFDGKTINPLVFWYPHGTGKFDWHQHPATWQKFQLLINLTEPEEDYQGGFTHIEIEDGSVEVFDHNFEKGDMFCFPYTCWHKVAPIFKGRSGETSKRVSLLMPLHPRLGVETKIRDKDGIVR